MGASGSVISGDRLTGAMQRGTEEFAKHSSSFSNLSENSKQLLLLKLGLEDNACADLYCDLLRYSKGEETSEMMNITEIHSQEDLLELMVTETDNDAASNIILVAEASEILYIPPVGPGPFWRQLKGMNIANNLISDESLASCQLLSTLTYLHIGGNKLGKMINFSKLIESNANLMVLDLSYTEMLPVENVPFFMAPQLKRLCLDGCDLATTVQTREDGSIISLFWGLVQLNELSLKENYFDSVGSLNGLEFFNFDSVLVNLLRPALSHLWLNDNPYQSIQAHQLEVEEYIIRSAPSLKSLNDKVLHSDWDSRPVDFSKVLKRDGAGGSLSVGGLQGEGLDNMEKEYLAALKNEKDCTVVK